MATRQNRTLKVRLREAETKPKPRRQRGTRLIDRDEKPPTPLPLMGLDRYECPLHGFAVDALKGSTVWCPCHRKCKVTAFGQERKQEESND